MAEVSTYPRIIRSQQSMETLALLELILFCVLLSELKSQFEIKFFIHSKENLGRLIFLFLLFFLLSSLFIVDLNYYILS